MKISLIAAVAENLVIGKDNDLPWRLPNDMKYFMNTTKLHYVLMGRKNYESIPEKFRPLVDRINVVVTKQNGFKALGCAVVNSIQEGINMAEEDLEDELFVIGGSEIYQQTIFFADKLYITEIKAEVDGNVFFPEYRGNGSHKFGPWKEISRIQNFKDEKHAYDYDFVVYER